MEDLQRLPSDLVRVIKEYIAIPLYVQQTFLRILNDLPDFIEDQCIVNYTFSVYNTEISGSTRHELGRKLSVDVNFNFLEEYLSRRTVTVSESSYRLLTQIFMNPNFDMMFHEYPHLRKFFIAYKTGELKFGNWNIFEMFIDPYEDAFNLYIQLTQFYLEDEVSLILKGSDYIETPEGWSHDGEDVSTTFLLSR